MKSSAKKIELAGYDDLFRTGGEAETGGEQVREIPLAELFPFKDHPFQVRDDEEMERMAESIAEHGVLVPGIVRPRKEGGYEIIAGHRRKRGCELAGRETMRAIVRDLTSAPAVQKLTTRDRIAQDAGEKSGMAVARYISLTKLIPPLLAMVDEEKLSLTSAADYVSDLPESEQAGLVAVMDKLDVIPGRSQFAKIKESSKARTLDAATIETILSAERPAAVQVVLKQSKLRRYFPQDYTARQMEEVIVSLLEAWSARQE